MVLHQREQRVEILLEVLPRARSVRVLPDSQGDQECQAKPRKSDGIRHRVSGFSLTLNPALRRKKQKASRSRPNSEAVWNEDRVCSCTAHPESIRKGATPDIADDTGQKPGSEPQEHRAGVCVQLPGPCDCLWHGACGGREPSRSSVNLGALGAAPLVDWRSQSEATLDPKLVRAEAISRGCGASETVSRRLGGHAACGWNARKPGLCRLESGGGLAQFGANAFQKLGRGEACGRLASQLWIRCSREVAREKRRLVASQTPRSDRYVVGSR